MKKRSRKVSISSDKKHEELLRLAIESQEKLATGEIESDDHLLPELSDLLTSGGTLVLFVPHSTEPLKIAKKPPKPKSKKLPKTTRKGGS